MRNLYRFLILLFVVGCTGVKNTNTKEIEIVDHDYKLIINPESFQFRFENKEGNIVVPQNKNTGLLLNGKPIVQTNILKASDSEKSFIVSNENGENAEVEIVFQGGIARFTVNFKQEKDGDIALQLGGMPVAHGLGDVAAFEESFNIVENAKNTYVIKNDGGGRRWVSTFSIFPQNNFAGVFFDKGKKTVIIDKNQYGMNLTKANNATFYYFLGNPKTMYSNYKKVREAHGYKSVKPKFRLFELGWESWDALGWNTNQVTVQDILQKFHDNNYPIRWVVTGSGFWDEGGTTTSFGRWGEKFSDATTFKSWMNKNDMAWMIGLRTNLIPEGGPYYPKTKKRDKNLKVKTFYGNALTTEAKKKDILVRDTNNQILTITSDIFPIVPAYLINGDAIGAAAWFQEQYAKWDVDGIKEDTMMNLDTLTNIYNKPMREIADKGANVMARNGEFVAPGTLLRINDTGVGELTKRIPINYMQYAACGFPNVYSDVAGVHNIHNIRSVDANIRHAWLLSLTSGLAVGAFPDKWPEEKQKVFKKAIDFHYAIAPYMYSEALKGYESGYPTTLTPLTIAYSNDSKVSELNNFQWMIGESILATPLLKNYQTGKMDVYLPEGVWFDYETGKKYNGKQVLNDYKIPLDKTPVFIGGKGIVIERTSDNMPLKAKVYPVSRSSQIYKFIYPDNKGVNIITYNGWGSINTLKVKDITDNKEIAYDYDAASGSISFEIRPNHNYQIAE
ncbi:hypothetical protein VOI54_14615 [Tamlana sp. 2201CG12-4]|uniref:hypothetical protein n=1 Tax=Tamlana sp. 2201CG12-4 TaxID=3112582 RepID=UPI002DBE584F|nr:hypothetical protein [Tamlana sp. 2201CG12-4]MEC3908259.1 hypothetical protein [Tamlana sp. 2201CG12-4]